ncbi:MAG: hypothetical protein JWR24_2864 [Actinoallomurus sp.]|nr:hypothetical protein [Actinoallomurus sp.]
MSSGLQEERTELAWLRTMLSCWAAALIAAKISFPVGTLAIMGPVAVTTVAHLRRRRLKGGGSPPPALPPAAAALVAASCVIIAIAGLFM